MRTLVVGAGLAGLTLAGLLARQDQAPVVVDRRVSGADAGYGLALWPHGSRVLHALGVHDTFVTRSEAMRTYVARDSAGRELTSSSMPESISAYGHLGIIPRSDLLGLLGSALGGADVREGVSIETLCQPADRVDVRFDDGTREAFDLVVGADGIHSRVRELLFGRIPDRDTGWGCYAWWADRELAGEGETTERWGAGTFLGTYPCRDRLCVIAGVPLDTLRGEESTGRAERLAGLFHDADPPVDALLTAMPGDEEDLFLWRMADVRAPHWVQGRVALVGDAAAAFLPTAGIGASMALESAAVLADELSRTDSAHLPHALELYQRRRRRRVEAAQTQSRQLARAMFLSSARLASVRNRALRLASLEQMVGPLIKGLRQPI